MSSSAAHLAHSNNPFTDPGTSTDLYATAGRLTQRTSALHRAKNHGSDVAATIAALTIQTPEPRVILDVGCGRGTSTIELARQHPHARVLAIDQSPALLREALARGHRTMLVADFHALPLPDKLADLAVAAFCLYHSPHPAAAAAEVGRCLRPGGRLIAVTKSVDSYQHLGQLLALADIDPHALRRPGLYTAFHSGNAADVLTEAGLHVHAIVDEHHSFRFTGLDHVAEYLATCPQYQLSPGLWRNPQALARELRGRLPDGPVTTNSTITYLDARTPQ